MANGKFWVLFSNEEKLITFKRWALGCYSYKASKFNSLKEAERAAAEYTKRYNKDVYIMESVALATVPTTIVKIEG